MSEPNLHIDLATLRRRRGMKWTMYGADVLPAWVADMDFPVADVVQRAILDLVEPRDYGYHSRLGPPAVRDAFVHRMQDRFGWQVQPSRVHVLDEVMQGVNAIVHLCSEPGDGVMVQLPIYPPFLSAVHANGRRLVENHLVRGNTRYEIDFDALRSAIDDRTRVMLLCHPHNPCGHVFTKDELTTLAEIAVERDLIVVSDEIHADLLYDGRTHTPFAALGPEVAERTVTVTSATKSFNFAGLRCAVMYCGSADLQQKVESLPNAIVGQTNCLGEVATVAAWREAQPWLDAVMAQLDANRKRVMQAVAEQWPGAVQRLPEATYLAWIDCAGMKLRDRPAKFFLKQAKVAFSDGKYFGEGYEQCVRLNFATAPAVLEEILARCANAVANAHA